MASTHLDSTFITRVLLKNYKSIAGCHVRLHPLTFLVGPNGSGKSNFLDALRFVSESLDTTLDHALRDRGGISDVRRRSSGHPTHFGIRLDFSLPEGQTGFYAFSVSARAGGAYEVSKEQCQVRMPGAPVHVHQYNVNVGEVSGSVEKMPPASSDMLYLVRAAGLTEFRPVYDAFRRMGFYNPDPERIRDLQSPDSGTLLRRDGSNITSVLNRMATHDPLVKDRIEEYIGKVMPSIHGIDVKVIGPKETLEFRQEVAGARHPWRFLAGSMSYGTLRALGVLVALFQLPNGSGRVSLVGIEEPEVALHPAAASVLLDALRDASSRTQVIVTSHSPDLLDDPSLDSDSVIAVTSDGDMTTLGPVDEAGRTALRDRLYTAGELLRLDQLTPDPSARVSSEQLRLFANGTA